MTTKTVQNIVQEKLLAALAPEHLEVHNESDRHSVPPGSESHFRLLVVASSFRGLSLVKRHRHIHGLLAEELAGGVHALAIEAFTPEEWRERGTATRSPECRGGSRFEKPVSDSPEPLPDARHLR